MQSTEQLKRTVDQSIVFANLSCLFFGLGLLLWAAAPAVIERMQTTHADVLWRVLEQSPLFLFGAALIGLHGFIRRRVRWSLWTSFLISVLFVGTGLAQVAFSGGQTMGMFILLLSAQAAAATWLAIDALNKQAAADAIAETTSGSSDQAESEDASTAVEH